MLDLIHDELNFLCCTRITVCGGACTGYSSMNKAASGGPRAQLALGIVLGKLFLEEITEMKQWPDTFQSYSQFIESA